MALSNHKPINGSWKNIMRCCKFLGLLIGFASSHLIAADLVVNGAMQNNASGWLKFPENTTRISHKIDGSINFVSLDTRENGMNAITTNIYQTVSLKSNTKYRLAFMAHSESGQPADLFVRLVRSDRGTTRFFENYKNPTIMTRRVRMLDINWTYYSIDFETGKLLAEEENAFNYALAFSSRTYGTMSALGGKVGISSVSLIDSPVNNSSTQIPSTANVFGPKASVTLDVNQMGYLGANKPFVFTMSNLPGSAISLHNLLKRTDGTTVIGKNGAPLIATKIADTLLDMESGNKVTTYSIDSTNLPDSLIDDLSDGTNAPTFGNRKRGYYIESLILHNGILCTTICMPLPSYYVIKSHPFPISKNVYAKMSSDALKYFVANTAGKGVSGYAMAIDDPAKNEQFRLAGHIESDKKAYCRGGVDRFGNNFGIGCASPGMLWGQYDVSGGWYDAGDQGKYVVNGGISLWTMQNLIERLQKKADTLPFGSPEQNSLVTRVQNLMRISKDEMDFMLRMQVPDGTKARVPVGYQGKKLSAAGGDFGYYQTSANPVSGSVPTNLTDAVAGSINFNAGKLPRLAIKLKLSDEDVTGMVFHSVTDENWTVLPTAPANDTERRVLTYPTSAATLNMAAVAAQAYRIWSWDKYTSAVTDINGAIIQPAAYAQRCLTASKKAYLAAKTRITNKTSIFRYEYSNDDWSAVDASKNNAWLIKNGAPLPPQWLGGGAYGDYRVKDEFYWASMELFLAETARANLNTSSDALIATAYRSYLESFPWTPTTDVETAVWSEFKQKHFPVLGYDWIKGFEWQNVTALGTLSALTVDKNRFVAGEKIAEGGTGSDNSTIVLKAASTSGLDVKLTSPQKNINDFATTLLGYVNAQPYRFAKQYIKTVDNLHNRDFQYEWGSNGNVINRAMILAIAYEATANKSYIDAAIQSMDYILGRNANGYSFVTGYGVNPIKHPHHRFWAKIIDPEYPAPVDGVLLGGPNSRDLSAILANANHTSPEGSFTSIDPVTSKDDRFYLEKAIINRCIGFDQNGKETFFYPQKCFIDHPSSFATSEVAINWNAPLAWMTQFLHEYGQTQ